MDSNYRKIANQQEIAHFWEYNLHRKMHHRSLASAVSNNDEEINDNPPWWSKQECLSTLTDTWEATCDAHKVNIVLTEDRRQPVQIATIARFRHYAHMHNYSVFLDGGDHVLDPNRSQVPRDLKNDTWLDADRPLGGATHFLWNPMMQAAYRAGRVEAVPFGLMTAWDTWNKISNALRVSSVAEEGSWIWMVDTDVVIMNTTFSLSPLIDTAERQQQIAIVVDWSCGDGINAGSLLFKNNEAGRSLIRRIQDSHLLYQTHFNGDQGSLWIVLAHSPNDLVLLAPPRTLNARAVENGCADELPEEDRPEAKSRVYYHTGDFLQHFAGIPHGLREAAQIKALKSVGTYPCNELCNIDEVARPPKDEDPPLAQYGRSAAGLTVVCVGSPEDSQIDTTCNKLLNTARAYNAETVASHVHKFFYINGSSVSEEHLARVQYTPFGPKDTARGTEGAHYIDNVVLFPSLQGWGGMVKALQMMNNKLQATQKDTGTDWLLVGGGGGPNAQRVQVVCEKITAAPRSARLIISRDCNGPWAILNSEWARTLLLRLTDSLHARKNRIELKYDLWGHEKLAEEDSGGFPEAMCMALRRDPSLMKYTERI